MGSAVDDGVLAGFGVLGTGNAHDARGIVDAFIRLGIRRNDFDGVGDTGLEIAEEAEIDFLTGREEPVVVK